MAACLGAWLLLSPAIRDWSQRALNANRPSLPDTTGGLGSGDALFVGDALVGGHALVGGGDLADPPQPGNTAGANLVEQPSADGTAAERSTGSIASSTSDPSAGPPAGPGRASARVQFELLQLHWDSDSQPLLWQMEAVHQTWLQEDQALDLWLKLLKDLPPQAAEKE
jgi:hypothetical protein